MKFTFKPFKAGKGSPAVDADSNSPDGSDKPQNPTQRRKEQVRLAQKTHRERKEAYTKSLEAEVIRLRANEARLFEETKLLYEENSLLKTSLVDNGIPVPSPALNMQVDERTEETFELSIRSTKTKRIHIQRQSRRRDDAKNDGNAYSGDGFSTSPPITAPRTLESHAFNQPDKVLGQFDQTTIGMDFILSLEAPCLDHIPRDPGDPGDPATSSSGHALMASATLLHHHDPSASNQPQSSDPTWHVHESGVQRLLDLANSFPLDGEMTPVQAWDQIRRHPQYEGLECSRLEQLKVTLLKHVKCYGFGAVITQGAFQDALFGAFVVGRVF